MYSHSPDRETLSLGGLKILNHILLVQPNICHNNNYEHDQSLKIVYTDLKVSYTH